MLLFVFTKGRKIKDFITFQHIKYNQTFNIFRDIFSVWKLVQSFENNKVKWYIFISVWSDLVNFYFGFCKVYSSNVELWIQNPEF